MEEEKEMEGEEKEKGRGSLKDGGSNYLNIFHLQQKIFYFVQLSI